MTQIVPIIKNSKEINAVDARTLHINLECKTKDFSTWIQRRISKFNFIEGLDYEMLRNKTGNTNRPRIEYLLTTMSAQKIIDYESMRCQIHHNNRKETLFFEMLIGIASKMDSVMECREDFMLQYNIGSFYLDCWIPTINTIVEYDEDYHSNDIQKVKDKDRESQVVKLLMDKYDLETAPNIIRVREGFESDAIAVILEALID